MASAGPPNRPHACKDEGPQSKGPFHPLSLESGVGRTMMTGVVTLLLRSLVAGWNAREALTEGCVLLLSDLEQRNRTAV